MKVIWLCNMIPGPVRKSLGGNADGGLWIDHVLADIHDVTLRVYCPGGNSAGVIGAGKDYVLFTEGLPYVYMPELENQFAEGLREFQPDVIHIWGTEYGHTLAMVNAAVREGYISRVVVSIQGLCEIYTRHYSEGIPDSVCRSYTFRDFVRRDNIRNQQEKFALRGKLEHQALEQVQHVIGRTGWDFACTEQVNPKRVYHFCNETLRKPFYEERWNYSRCHVHRIFASSCLYPIKGFHYLLEAFSIVSKFYPDAEITVTGTSVFASALKEKLREETYSRYLSKLCPDQSTRNRIHFLGSLNAEEMKQAYLDANVFVLPSTIENSPNSLGEAMLLGVPCVAADVGGVSDMLHEGEGYIYPASEVYMLAHYIMKVFAEQDRAEAMGKRAREHALKTHDPDTNMETLLNIYQSMPDK